MRGEIEMCFEVVITKKEKKGIRRRLCDGKREDRKNSNLIIVIRIWIGLEKEVPAKQETPSWSARQKRKVCKFSGRSRLAGRERI